MTNVVLIITDDEKYSEIEDGMLRDSFTANMLDEGVWFPRYHVCRSVCSPSRATYITGQYGHNNGSTSVGHWNQLDRTNLLYKWLWGTPLSRQVQTGVIGKLNNDYDDSGLSTVAWPTPPGIDHWRVFNYHGAVAAPQVREEDYNADGTLASGAFYPPNTVMSEWTTDYCANAAVELIDLFTTRAPSDDRFGLPFFLQVCPTTPHAGSGQAPTLTGDPTGRAARKAAYNDPWLPPFWTPPTDYPNVNLADLTTSRKTSERNRMKGLVGVDDLVASVIAKLDDAGVLDDTIIIYTSDNGWANGEHGDWAGKNSMYESVMKVPMVIRGPGFTPDTINQGRFANVDIAPTLCAWFGVEPGLACDGVDFTPVIANETAFNDRAVFLTASPQQSNAPGAGARGFVGIRTDRYKFCKYVKASVPNGEPAQLLFDLEFDPFEMSNEYQNPAYVAIKADLDAVLGSETVSGLRNCAGATCHIGVPGNGLEPLTRRSTMSEATNEVRGWADSDRTQAAVIRWLVAVGAGDAAGDLSEAQADTLDATAEGWDAVANAADLASGEVGNPDGSP